MDVKHFTVKLKRTASFSSASMMLCLFISIFVTHQATAQNAPISDVEVISVSASKQAMNLSLTPHSVSVVLQDDLQQLAPQHISQALSQVPGTWISRGNGQEHLSAIRSPVLTGAGSCGAFFMGLDGISIRAPGFCNANQLFDINFEQAASIDVLRSPASTLYGSNALHGVINVISADAFNAPSNSLSVRLGAEDFARISGVYQQKNNQSAWLTLANITQENGYQEDSGYDQQKLTSIYQHSGDIWRTKTVLDVANLNQETAGFIRGFEAYKDSQIRRSNPNPEAYRDVKSLRFYSKLSRNTELGELTLTPYARANSMAFLQHFLPWQALEKNSHNSVGIQSTLSTATNNLTTLLGADVDITQGALKETQAAPFSDSIPAGTHYNYEVNAMQAAVYVQTEYATGAWLISAGARGEQNYYDYTNLANGNSACADTVDVCRFSRPDSQSKTFNAISPSANVRYTLNNNTTAYIKYAQGFRAPQATELFRLQNNQQITDINNEKMSAWETGVRWFNDTTNLHASAYYMEKSNVIFQDTDRQNVTGAQTSHQGGELELSHQVNANMSIQAQLSYGEHRYENNISLVSIPVKGNLIDTAPKWMSKVSANYYFNDALSARLSWQYLSKYYLDPANTAEYKGHQLIDLHLYYQAHEQVNLSLHVINLTNQDYAERADFAFGSYRYFIGQPARAFINLQWLF